MVVAAAVATETAAVTLAATLAAAAVMVTAEARATAMAMTLLAASGGGNGSNCMTMDVCNAILPRDADVINVGSNNDGNLAPAINEGNIDKGLPTLTLACGARAGFSNDGGERAATPAAAVAAEVGRGSTVRRKEAWAIRIKDGRGTATTMATTRTTKMMHSNYININNPII